MKRDIKIYSILVLSLLIMFIVPTITALGTDNVTLIIDHKNNDNVLNGRTAQKVVVNVSVGGGGGGIAAQNYTTAVAYIVSAGATANTTLFAINTTEAVRNITSSNSGETYNISISINTSTLEDGNDYTLYIQLWNGTDKFNETATITIDNGGVPTSASSLLPASDTDGTVNFSATVTDADTTACYINFSGINPGSPSYAGSYSGTTCSVQRTAVSAQSYTWFVTTSDGTNSTASSTQTTNVEFSTGAGSSMTPEQVRQAQKTRALATASNNPLPINNTTIIIGVVVLVIIVLYLRRK